jgi:autotransporter-associated beta strand protein
MVPGGTVTLHGANTYTGPTTVFPGTLIVKKAAGLYHGDTAKWTPVNMTVHKAATLRLSVGGPGEFTGTQISALLANLTTGVNGNGLMAGSVLHMDTANATGPVVLTGNIADSKGPGGGPFIIKKSGSGTLQLAGANTGSGQMIFENGTLVVSSINRVVGGKPSSNLGAPSSLENGIIPLGGDCVLTYTGKGEETDRIMDLAGEKQTVTFEQAGSGLLKFTSPFDISGLGHSKTIILKGSTAGIGEFAGAINNPHDRKQAATTALTKTGTGLWILSGTHGFTGPTTVAQGTLALANARSLRPNTEVTVAEGATLELRFKGELRVRKLILGGKAQAAGRYSSADTPAYIKGIGVLSVK